VTSIVNGVNILLAVEVFSIFTRWTHTEVMHESPHSLVNHTDSNGEMDSIIPKINTFRTIFAL